MVIHSTAEQHVLVAEGACWAQKLTKFKLKFSDRKKIQGGSEAKIAIVNPPIIILVRSICTAPDKILCDD